MKTGPKPRPTIDRLMEKVIIDGDCWIFTGAKGGGYGKTWYIDRPVDVHRVSYSVFIGDIPPKMHVCHSCDVRLCFNPDHLFLGTAADNLADMRAKGRHSKGESHSEALRRIWTPEKRKEQSHRLIQARLDKRFTAAKEAGVPLDWKLCPRCHIWQPMVKFGENAARSDGVNSYCNPCRYSL